MKLGKSSKIVICLVLSIWLLFTSFITFIWFKSSWTQFLIEDSKSLLPLFSEDPVSYDNGELDVSKYLSETKFPDRIQVLDDSYFLTVIDKSINSPVEVPDNSHEEYIASFKNFYNQWPEKLKNYVDSTIYKVFIVKNLISSAEIISLNDQSAFVILIDEAEMQQTPNEWATNVQRMNFENVTDGHKFNVKIEEELDPVLTFENLLIHEIGHAIGVTSGLTPDFNGRGILRENFKFYDKTYDKFLIEFEKKNESEKIYERLQFYEDIKYGKIDFNEYVTLLKSLDNTSYPTMYSSRNAIELFAEYFYSYVHCILQNKPYQYTVIYPDGDSLIITNGISEERCYYEKSFIVELFEN